MTSSIMMTSYSVSGKAINLLKRMLAKIG